jgi:undecaprenyl diphosphate synthase
LSQKIPQHVAIVMDGNGRWAENQGLPRTEGHRRGVEVTRSIVQTCLQKNILVLSLFAFSRENWARPPEEVEFLMQLFLLALEQQVPSLNENGVRLQFIGDRNQLSSALCTQMVSAEELTRQNDRLVVNVAVNYTGRWDILQAVKKVVASALRGEIGLADVDESLTGFLSTYGLPEPDLLIRTSGEQRISDFFLWQIAFTEFYFTDVKWPEFTVEEFERALDVYHRRERRYGLISSQVG